MINRREFLGVAAGASRALTPQLPHALQQILARFTSKR